MTRWLMACGAVTMLAAMAQPAGAAPPGPRDPDWPCQSIKVPAVSPASFWQGPSLDPYLATWNQDPAVADFVTALAPRRVSVDEAKQRIAAFAAQSGAKKQERLLAVVAGLFDVLNRERDSVISGLDRFGHRQKELASDLRADVDQMHTLQAADTPDTQQLTTLGERLQWETRVFEDRRKSLSFVCDVPNQIEQRLYGLAQAVQAQLN